jgi:hypothetical protein
VQPDHFNDRLAVVRNRFASSLEGKIKDTYAEMPTLIGGDASAVDAVQSAYRRIHGICGIGRAVGFPRTGCAAKDVQEVLIGPYRGRRGLEAAEMARLEKALGVLATTSQKELSSVSPTALSKNVG